MKKVLALVLMLIMLLSCGAMAEEKPLEGKFIPVLPLGVAHQFWQAVKMGAEQAAEEAVDMSATDPVEQKEEAKAYSGPSVISWTLEGRKARVLPVPAYKGYGAGDVYVKIKVNRSGRVVAAAIIEESSSSDKSLHEFAVDAAKRSRFSGSDTAPNPQQGEIVYRFIAQ